MMATTSGTVKEMYKGLNHKYKATNLKPQTEYIFCVKANYEDGSMTWSNPQPFMTTV